MIRTDWLFGALLAFALLPAACGDERPPGAPADPGKGGTTPLAHGGEPSSTEGGGQNQGGADEADAGDTGTSEGGMAGGGGTSSAGTAPVNGGSPPVGPEPVCAHDASFGEGTALLLSGAGDDVLQAVTPDELSIAWKNGDDFFVADRNDPEEAFGQPLPVTGSNQYRAITLGSDSSLLIAVRKDLSVVEMRRSGPGAPFDEAAPGAGSFEQFNTTLSSVPFGNQVLTDPVMSYDGSSFIFSHFSSGKAGSYATVQESVANNGPWSLSSGELGVQLYAQDDKRRVPTGVSADLLTLFYLDEVEGEFRAAWRVNQQLTFDYVEPLDLGTGAQAAAPNALCDRIYFSASGDDDLDLFVADLITN